VRSTGARIDGPVERSYLSLIPRRNLRRALFLLLALMAVVALKKSGGGFFHNLLESVSPPPPSSPPAPPHSHGSPLAPREPETTVHLAPGAPTR
jgi:hypothetical protein